MTSPSTAWASSSGTTRYARFRSRLRSLMDRFPPRAELVVIGGGVVGAASAFYASRQGIAVVLLERRSALASLTTTRSLEAFRAQFDEAEDIRMMKEGIDVFERFADVVGLPGYDLSLHQQGYLFVTQAA